MACSKAPEPELCPTCPECVCKPEKVEVEVIKEVVIEKECNSSYVLSLIRQIEYFESRESKYLNYSDWEYKFRKCNRSYVELNETYWNLYNETY